jgi:hypothetical protein
MSITIYLFGSFVDGATSEGGGAVASPVMTLALGIAPVIARDFCFHDPKRGNGIFFVSSLFERHLSSARIV